MFGKKKGFDPLPLIVFAALNLLSLFWLY